jgi:hypothetical protein
VSNCLNRRRFLTFGIIASGLFLSNIVLIGQLRINLTIGVEVLEYEPTG